MAHSILGLRGVRKTFETREVLKHIDLTIPEGTIMGLVGKNGAGKSTIIKCLLGLLKPDAGDATVFDEPSWNLSAESKQRIGYVPQVLIGFRWMRIETMLDYTGAFYSRWNKKLVESLLKEWDLDPWSQISMLSEGEKQKLSIIQAMGHEPDVYIFDEPVASLDPVARRKFIKQLLELNINESKTILFSTHITSDLERVAADVAMLIDGKIVLNDDISTLKDRFCRLHIHARRQLPQPLPIANALHVISNGTSAVLTVDGINEDSVKSLERELSAEIRVEQLNLEEIFLELNK